jgi:hypothetical protein
MHWGNGLWAFIHSVTLVEIFNTYTILTNIEKIIPCELCKSKYIYYLSKLNDLDPNDNLRFFKWSVDLHNEVNHVLGKPLITYEDALLKWS